jgi:hypothetical protein
MYPGRSEPEKQISREFTVPCSRAGSLKWREAIMKSLLSRKTQIELNPWAGFGALANVLVQAIGERVDPERLGEHAVAGLP